ncbi:hypothetical protein TKK_0012055 [Trichogramma kaykai]
MSQAKKFLSQKAQEFLGSRKYANNLLDMMDAWEDCTEDCISTFEHVFTQLLKRGDMYMERNISLTEPESNPELIYKNWLRELYDEKLWDKLSNAMDATSNATQTQALTTAINLMVAEGNSPIDPVANVQHYFPVHRLKLIMMKLLSADKNNTALIERFQEVTGYSDVLFHTWRSLPTLTPKTQPPDFYIKNLLEFLKLLPLEVKKDAECLCGPQNAASEFKFDYAVAKKSLNKVWSRAIRWELTPELHKQILFVLIEKVMPHLEKPVLLLDFLMDSLDVQGPIGVLALQGMFVLVTKHNLEYPNIFTKLYSMFEPEIFHTKYKARLFYLADIFLTSTHLPEGLVAAFAKRLSRLTLVAPPEDILIILLFVGNLMMRHRGLKCLIDNPQNSQPSGVQLLTPSGAAGDPYLMEERDPLQSNAINSSLWEIKALQDHVLPSVATAARFIREPLPQVEYDLAGALERTSGQIFERELKKKVKDIMLTYERPTSMALPKNERLLQYWDLGTMS